MSTPDLASLWKTAMRRAHTLDPAHIAPLILQEADNGLRAARYDKAGSRTSFVPCDDPKHCDDGPTEHSHMLSSDPTGNAAINGHHTDTSLDELRRLNSASIAFVNHALEVLEFVSEHRPTTWVGVLQANAKLMPGTVQAGLDVDHESMLPFHINAVSDAVAVVAGFARALRARPPSRDEQLWTAGMADEDCCVWHLAIHQRYRRPRTKGKNICATCVHLATISGQRPPEWVLEAEIDSDSKPHEWRRTLSRWLDTLDVPAHERAG